MHKRGSSRFSVAIFWSHSSEKIRRGTLLCLKMLRKREIEGGEYHAFPSKLFCLTVQKQIVEEPFCVSESFQY